MTQSHQGSGGGSAACGAWSYNFRTVQTDALYMCRTCRRMDQKLIRSGVITARTPTPRTHDPTPR